jgi:Uma2 family endonuclease
LRRAASRNWRNGPQFLCEVLSDSTRALDRREKFAEYRLIDPFTEYLLLELDRIEAELHRKGVDGRWTCATFGERDDLIQFESLGITLRLGNLYDKVEFPTSS